MAIKRHFLNCDRPALQTTADFLLAKYRRQQCLDLDRVILVTTGSRAGRGLEAVLLDRVEAEGLTYFPPTLTTVGRLPEMLYQAPLPYASEWVQQVAWSDAVRNADRDTRLRVFPHSHTEPTDGNRHDGTDKWLALGRLLQSAYRELAAAGLSFADVAERAAGLKNSPDTGPFPETARWQAMAIMQEGYLRRLAGAGLGDRQTARLEAIRGRACTSDCDIVLVATADLNHALRMMLEQVAERVTALVHAPEEWSSRFDVCGSVVAAAWQTATIPLADEQITIVDQYADQAEAVVDLLAAVGEGYTSQEISIGCPDQGLVPHVERCLAEAGLQGRWGPGRGLCESRPYQLLEAIRQVITTQRFDALASLLRHPDIADWLSSRQVPPDWEAYLDEYRSEHLPLQIPHTWLGNKDRFASLQRATHEVSELCRPLRGASMTLASWAECIGQVISNIYADADWSRVEERRTAMTCNAICGALSEFAATPADFDTSTTAARALELLLEQLASETLPDDPDGDAIELLGWLELPLDRAPLLIVTGLAEGVVPQSNRADMFLPNGLRKHLAIEDDEHRYARDAYALSVLCRSHAGLALIVSRHDAAGDPLRPSRLLFADEPDVVTTRWLRLLAPAATTGSQPITTSDNRSPPVDRPTFAFTIPRPEPLTEPVTRMRITDFKSYLACRYRYYLQRQLGLGSVDDVELEMDGGLFGTVLHDVFNDFGSGPMRDSTDANEIAGDLQAHLARHLRRRLGSELPPAIRVQQEQMRLRLDAFAAIQARRRREGWRIMHVEAPQEQVAQITVKEGTIDLSGRIDRIDRHESSGAYAILDYKTSDAGHPPEKVHQHGPKAEKRWIDLQLPLYRYIAQAMGIKPITEVGYILLPKKLDAICFCAAEWTESDYREAMRTAEQVVSGVLRQEFWPPGEPVYAPGDEFAGILMSGVLERPEWGDSGS